jgi:hypothetical protein
MGSMGTGRRGIIGRKGRWGIGTGGGGSEGGGGGSGGGIKPGPAEARKWRSLDKSTARSTPHCGQRKRSRPWGTLRTALQRAQGSWILVGSTPCARGGAERRARGCGTGWGWGWGGGGGCGGSKGGGGGGGVGPEGGGVGEALGGEGGMSSGGSRCAMRHLGQMNSVMPGATASTPRQPAQRTWTGADAAGEAPRPAIVEGEGFGREDSWGTGGGRERRDLGLGFYRGSGMLFTRGWEFLPVFFSIRVRLVPCGIQNINYKLFWNDKI